MTQVSHLLGANESHAAAELFKIIEFEKKMAEISVPEVERIDTSAIYSKTTIAELAELVPQINWMLYFRHLVYPMNITENESIVSYSTPFFINLGKLLEVTDKRVIHNYIIWRQSDQMWRFFAKLFFGYFYHILAIFDVLKHCGEFFTFWRFLTIFGYF